MSSPELSYPADEITIYEVEDALLVSDFQPELIGGGLLDDISPEVEELDSIQDNSEPVDDAENKKIFSEELQTAIPEDMDSLQLYINQASVAPLLKPHEEILLAKKIEAGDENAKNQMIDANLRLVISVVKRYRGKGVPFLDLISDGNIGLIRAVEKFDHTKGFKFSTYATWWIRQSAQRCLANNKHTIRTPVHIADRIYRIRTAREEYKETHGQQPSIEVIHQKTGISIKHIKEAERALDMQPSSLNKLMNEEGDGEAGDLVHDKSIPSVETEVINSINTAGKYLLRLSPRELQIIELRESI